MPFVVVAPFDELDDAIEKANATEYGLTAGLFSEEQGEIDEWLDRIQAGVVYVNRQAGSTTGAWPGVQPFGGWKGVGHDRQGRRRPLLHAAVPARAVEDGDLRVSLEDMELEGLAAHARPKLITEVPGPEAMARIERDRKVTSPSLPRAYPFVPRRGSGSIVEDVDGNIFLDLNAGIAVTSTGHCHPTVVEAVQRQATQLLHYSASDFFLPIYSEVCERLDAMAPFGGRRARSFLTNSGTEAVEAAIKLARYATGRQYLIGFYQSFHGRSMGSVTLTASKARYRTGFGPMMPSVYHSFYGDFEYLEQVLFKRIVSPTEVAAIVVESWLGEGGYVLPPEGWFTYLRELCDRHGILLVCDEVQSGMGRSGTMWAIEQEGIAPDIDHRRQGHREWLAARRDDRPRRPDDVGARRARLDVRWLADLVRRCPRDVRGDRAGRDCSTTRARSGRSSSTGFAPSPSGTRSSPRCVAGRSGSDSRSPITTRHSRSSRRRSARGC